MKMRKLLAAACAAALCISATGITNIGSTALTDILSITANAVEYTDSSLFDYDYLEDGTIEITDYNGEDPAVIIPPTIDGGKVTSVSENFITYNTDIVSISIPYTVSHIGISVSSSEEYTPSQLTRIDVATSNEYYSSLGGVLYNKDKTQLVKYPTMKEDKTFYIPDSVEEICYFAFVNCPYLEHIVIPKNADIDRQPTGEVTAFYNCSALISYEVSEDNELYSSSSGILYSKSREELVAYPAGRPNEILNVSSDVKIINEYAFKDSLYLQEVNLSTSVTAVENNAFMNSHSLKSVYIPYSVEQLGSTYDNIFRGCNHLENINVSEGNKKYFSKDGVLFARDMLWDMNIDDLREQVLLLAYPAAKKDETYAIPNDVSMICSFSFNECNALKEIVIPDSTTRIMFGAFEECLNLKYIRLPNSIDFIDSWAFDNCGADYLIAPDTIREFDTWDDDIFHNYYGVICCKKNSQFENILKEKNISSEKYSYYEGDFAYQEIDDKSVRITCYIGNSKVVEVPSKINGKSVKEIEAYAFSDREIISEVVLPDGLQVVGDSAFEDCPKLKSVTIPRSVEYIGNCAFGYYFVSSDDGLSGYTEKYDDFVINCYWNTEGEWYAVYNDFDYFLLDEPQQVGTANVPGTAKNPNVDITDMGITFEDESGETYTAEVQADGKIMLPALPAGVYNVTASLENCPSRDYTVKVESGKPVEIEVELKLYGDISGDGKLTVFDVMPVNKCAQKTGTLEGYDFKVADVTNDNKLDVFDCMKINAHIKKTTLMW